MQTARNARATRNAQNVKVRIITLMKESVSFVQMPLQAAKFVQMVQLVSSVLRRLTIRRGISVSVVLIYPIASSAQVRMNVQNVWITTSLKLGHVKSVRFLIFIVKYVNKISSVKDALKDTMLTLRVTARPVRLWINA